MEIEDLALSPDGRVVSFQYVDRAKHRGGVGLLDWHSGKLTKIPVAGISEVSFSPDGERLVASTWTHLVVIDLTTFETKQVTDEWPQTTEYQLPRQVPVFQPGTNKILYVTGYPEHLRLVDPVDHTEQVVLNAKHGFYAISRPSFVGSDEIVFTGRDPKDPQLSQWLKNKGLRNISAITYRLKFGRNPEFALKEIFEHTTNIYPNSFVDVANVAASPDGKKTVFIDFSSTEPNLRGKYNYEIFLLEDGKVTQLTHLNSHMRCVAISADGSTVAFGSDPTRTRTHDLFILELSSGVIRQMFLAQRLEKSVEFNQD